MGTPYYIAPEVLNENYGQKCDLWSDGVVLYEMVTGGWMPFNAHSKKALFDKIKSGKYHKIPDHLNLSDELKDLISKLLVVDPN